jgi:hypothetical protein
MLNYVGPFCAVSIVEPPKVDAVLIAIPTLAKPTNPRSPFIILTALIAGSAYLSGVEQVTNTDLEDNIARVEVGEI